MNTDGAAAPVALGPVAAADYPALVRFLAAFPENAHTEAEWARRLEHWWDRNPAFSEGQPRGWLLRDEGGAVVGFLGNVPRAIRDGGRDRVAFSASTWRVAPEYRHASLRLYAAHLAAGREAVLLNNTANATAAAVLDRLKFSWRARSCSGQSYMLPLAHGRVAEMLVRTRGIPRPLRSAMALALATSAVPAAWTLRRTGPAARELDESASGVDDLWQRTRDEVPWTAVRSAAVLNWFRAGADRGRTPVFVAAEGGRLTGLSTFRLAQRGGLRQLELVDLWPASTPDRDIRAMMAAAVAWARRSDVDLLVLHDFGTAMTRAFRGAGLVVRTRDTGRVYVRGSGGVAADAGYLTDFDGDAWL